MATRRQEQRIPMSWDDYEALGDDVWGEYIDGNLVVSPLPGYWHQMICHALVAHIKAVLPPDHRVVSHWGWKPRDDEFGPDVIVCDDGGDDRRFTGVPHLVVEVLSSNRSADTVRKLRKYAEAGVPRYWIVDPAGPEVIVSRGTPPETSWRRPATSATSRHLSTPVPPPSRWHRRICSDRSRPHRERRHGRASG